MATQKTLTIIGLLITIALLATAQDSYQAEGGNITEINLSGTTQTERWQGFAGTIVFVGPTAPSSIAASGGDVNGTTVNIAAACSVPLSVTGQLLFSNSSSTPTGLTAGNLTQLDAFVDAPAGLDTGSIAFNTTSTFDIGGSIPGVPTTFTFVNSAFQNTTFREGYLNDAAGNLVFAIDVDLDSTGYNGSSFDFQALLPVQNKTDTTYFLSTNLNIVCPAAAPGIGGGGGGGGGARCIPDWECTAWEPCTEGRQNRTCREISNCQTRASAYPPLVRTCPEEERGGYYGNITIPGTDLVKELHDRNFEITLPDDITANAGDTIDLQATVHNPDSHSMEQLVITVGAPAITTAYQPLHTSPHFYTLANVIPAKPVQEELTIASEPLERFRLNPEDNTQVTIPLTIPLIQPQTITARVHALSADIPLTSQPINIKVETPPFALAQRKDGRNTQIFMLIDNREQPKQTAHVELAINNGRTTPYANLHSLDLPANGIGLYAHEYRVSFPYDAITARHNNFNAEVR